MNAAQEVNSDAYKGFHNAQMFQDGFSFSGFERNMTWLNDGRSFVDLSGVSGADTPNDSRAVVAADFDDDGDVDLFVHSIQRERHALFRNDIVAPGTPDAGFLKLRLRATTSQHEAIGATVVVDGPAGATAQVLSRGAAFLSCQPPELVFGLGAREEAAVTVIWPGGRRESFGELLAGTRALLVEGSGTAEPLPARPRRLPDPLPPGLLVAEGDLVPRVAVVDREGRPAVLDVASIAGGKSALLNLWASYCAPCVAELPLLQEREEGGELSVVALSVDVPEDAASARGLLDRHGAGFAAFFLPEPGTPAPEGTVSVGALVDLERLEIPTTLVLSPEGRIESILRGPIGE